MNIKQYDFYHKLRALPFVEQICLFGSRAKQLARKHSDIDLAIVCPTATQEEWQAIRQIIDNADTLLQIDCIRLDTVEDESLRRSIEKSKIVLFQRVENNYEWYDLFLDLQEALEKFHDILSMDKTEFPYLIEATLQIFEYSYELLWKLLKKICLTEGVEVNTPRATFQQAYIIKLIHNEQIWLEIMESRNLTSHTYKHATANRIYEQCKHYLPEMESALQAIRTRYAV